MLDILPALLWIVAAVIAVNICSITAIRGNIFSKTKRDVYPVRWSIVGLHFTSLVIGALPYPVYAMFKSGFSAKFQRFYEQVGWPSAALMILLIAAELVSAGQKWHEKRNGKKTQTSHQRLTVKGAQRSENATRHTVGLYRAKS